MKTMRHKRIKPTQVYIRRPLLCRGIRLRGLFAIMLCATPLVVYLQFAVWQSLCSLTAVCSIAVCGLQYCSLQYGSLVAGSLVDWLTVGPQKPLRYHPLTIFPQSWGSPENHQKSTKSRPAPNTLHGHPLDPQSEPHVNFNTIFRCPQSRKSMFH